MPILGLRDRWEEPVDAGRKTRTTRRNAPYYFKVAGFKQEDIERILLEALNAPVKCTARNHSRLHLWIGTRGRWKRKLGESPESYAIEAWKGEHFTDGMAVEDGFGTAQEMRQWLAEAHAMTMAQVNEHVWVSFPLRLRRPVSLDDY